MGFWIIVRERHCYYFYCFTDFKAFRQKLNFLFETLFFTVAINIPKTSKDWDDKSNHCKMFSLGPQKCHSGVMKGMDFLLKEEGGLCSR